MHTLALSALMMVGSGLIDGRPALPQELPWTIFIENNCTATKIAPKMFMTAAHCIMNENKSIKPMYWKLWRNLGLGIRSHSSRTFKIKLEDYFIHPSYENAKSYQPGIESYDVAIITVSNETPDIPVAKLNFDEVKTNDKVIIGGYGCEEKYQEIRPNQRKYKIAETEVTNSILSAEYNFTSLGKSGYLCLGDSGGGVFKADTQELVGVNSLTLIRQEDGARINGHARLSRIQSWVEDIFSRY